jgi:transcription antitermination factor NusG
MACTGHAAEHRDTGQERSQNAIDSHATVAVTVAHAQGAQHLECGSNGEPASEISKRGRGGARPNSGGARPGAGRKPKPKPLPRVVPVPVVAPVPAARWLCIECWVGRELQVITELHLLQLRTFLPLYLPEPGAVLEPAFPGYVFALTDPADPTWRKIHGRPGVIQVLRRDAERPMEVSAHVMAGLVRLYGEGGTATVPGNRPQWAGLRVGIDVRVMSGPFDGAIARVLQDLGPRVRVVVDLFGRRTECELPRAAVAPL